MKKQDLSIQLHNAPVVFSHNNFDEAKIQLDTIAVRFGPKQEYYNLGIITNLTIPPLLTLVDRTPGEDIAEFSIRVT